MERSTVVLCLVCAASVIAASRAAERALGVEVAVGHHLSDGDEFRLSLKDLLAHGQKLFSAAWTVQEGAGRPLMTGTGAGITDPLNPLTFPRNFSRISAPDANSCAGCHNLPFGFIGGGGDVVANVFVLAQRFDFVDPAMPGDTMDERGRRAGHASLANPRATTGVFGAGYLEMLARQISFDLQSIRDRTQPGERRKLLSKGISFGSIARNADGSWDTTGVEGLPEQSIKSTPHEPPALIVQPWHQAGAVISLRQFTNNAFNHHHGIQAAERFGRNIDADGDGFVNELTAADVTAATLFQAAMPVPGRVIPRDRRIEKAILDGEKLFSSIGCAVCHLPALPLDRKGWIFTEPSPLNPAGNLKAGEVPLYRLDLGDERLPQPRLKPSNGVVMAPAYTDFKLHDICSGPEDPNREPLNMNEAPGSPAFFAGNSRFLTKRLWGAANEPPYFHHGKFTTLREAILAHEGEARNAKLGFVRLPGERQGAVIEFLKSLQVLPPGTRSLVVDEFGRARSWPAATDVVLTKP